MPKRILIVDDEELIIKSLKKLLEKKGYVVFVAKNGTDALIMAEEESFDLIIADIRMPGMNGVETINSINDTLAQKKANKPPVIFITGYADEEIKKKAKALNPVAYIYKPFDIADIIDKVRKVLE